MFSSPTNKRKSSFYYFVCKVVWNLIFLVFHFFYIISFKIRVLRLKYICYPHNICWNSFYILVQKNESLFKALTSGITFIVLRSSLLIGFGSKQYLSHAWYSILLNSDEYKSPKYFFDQYLTYIFANLWGRNNNENKIAKTDNQ